MTKYIHDPAPNQKAESFINWCVKNITVWDDNYKSVARYSETRNKWWKKNFIWREHHSGLSYAWLVCTKNQWEEASKEKRK